jgi:hypothetical protein
VRARVCVCKCVHVRVRVCVRVRLLHGQAVQHDALKSYYVLSGAG